MVEGQSSVWEKCTMANKMEDVDHAAVYFAISQPQFLRKPQLLAFNLATFLEKHRCAYDAGI